MTSRPNSRHRIQLTLLTKNNCPLCDHAKQVLDSVQSAYLVDVEVVWLETPRGRELVERHDTPFPPVLLIADELHGYGRLSEKKLRLELQRIGVRRRSWWGRLRGSGRRHPGSTVADPR